MHQNKLETLMVSNDLDDLIGRPPGWIVRWGITLFTVIIFMLLILGYYIKYPDTLSVSCRIFAENTSIPVRLNSSGQIKKLNIWDGKMVYKNDVLLYWKDNKGDYLTVFAPSTGIVQFISSLTTDKNVSQNQVLFYIQLKQSYFASFYVDSATAKNLKFHQNLSIAVPPFGNLLGKINVVDNFKTANGYYVKANLVNGLNTEENKTIPFHEVINGNVDIIVAKKRLISKLTEKFMN